MPNLNAQISQTTNTSLKSSPSPCCPLHGYIVSFVLSLSPELSHLPYNGNSRSLRSCLGCFPVQSAIPLPLGSSLQDSSESACKSPATSSSTPNLTPFLQANPTFLITPLPLGSHSFLSLVAFHPIPPSFGSPPSPLSSAAPQSFRIIFRQLTAIS